MILTYSALTTTFLVALVSNPASAQTNPAGEDLFDTQTLSCSFPEFASADWEGAALSTRLEEGQKFTVIFDQIDIDAGTAQLVGAVADAAVRVVKGGFSISILEITPVGTPNLTTIFADLDGDLRFTAVQSRHLWMGGPTPSQNYGSCEALEFDGEYVYTRPEPAAGRSSPTVFTARLKIDVTNRSVRWILAVRDDGGYLGSHTETWTECNFSDVRNWDCPWVDVDWLEMRDGVLLHTYYDERRTFTKKRRKRSRFRWPQHSYPLNSG